MVRVERDRLSGIGEVHDTCLKIKEIEVQSENLFYLWLLGEMITILIVSAFVTYFMIRSEFDVNLFEKRRTLQSHLHRQLIILYGLNSKGCTHNIIF